MKITGIKYFVKELTLKAPYTIAYETIASVKNVFLKIETSTGICGYGCAAPDFEVTGESGDSVVRICEEVFRPSLIGTEALRYIKILEDLSPYIKSDPSAMAMLDMALFDIMGKFSGLPVYMLLGGYRTKISTSITVGIMSLKDTVSMAENYIRQGFIVLKIKGGINVEDDIRKVLDVREKVGKKIEIRFDANQGYTFDEAVHFVQTVGKENIEIFEQPTPKEDYQMLGRVSKGVQVPVMADESLMNLRDVFHLAKGDLTDMINIKLMKVGGIAEAMRINSVARAAGFEVMVGCMDESELSIAAGLHFALARPNIVYADLDGHLDLVDDPARGSVLLKNGILYPSKKPGLGIKMDF